jgi:hypothetical protein
MCRANEVPPFPTARAGRSPRAKAHVIQCRGCSKHQGVQLRPPSKACTPVVVQCRGVSSISLRTRKCRSTVCKFLITTCEPCNTTVQSLQVGSAGSLPVPGRRRHGRRWRVTGHRCWGPTFPGLSAGEGFGCLMLLPWRTSCSRVVARRCS